jgi:hypothetical protein
VITIMNIVNFLSSCTNGGFPRRAQLHEVSLVIAIGFSDKLLYMLQ